MKTPFQKGRAAPLFYLALFSRYLPITNLKCTKLIEVGEHLALQCREGLRSPPSHSQGQRAWKRDLSHWAAQNESHTLSKGLQDL